MIRTSLKPLFSPRRPSIRVKDQTEFRRLQLLSPFQNLTLIFGWETGPRFCLGLESWNYETKRIAYWSICQGTVAIAYLTLFVHCLLSSPGSDEVISASEDSRPTPATSCCIWRASWANLLPSPYSEANLAALLTNLLPPSALDFGRCLSQIAHHLVVSSSETGPLGRVLTG